MLINLFKIAYRNLLRQKFYTGINVAGLTLGVAGCLLIFMFVQHELSYDNFHAKGEKSDNIKAWESIRVLHEIGVLNFQGFASNKIKIPESSKSLVEMLEEMKSGCLSAMNRWATTEYTESNKFQIKYLSESVKKIDAHLKQM